MKENAITVITDATHELWIAALVNDCKAIITEAVFTSRWALIEGYHMLGERVSNEHNLDRKSTYGKKIASGLAQSIGISERTLNRAIQFYEKYPSLDLLPDGKNITWNKIVNQYLPEKTGNEIPGWQKRLRQAYNVVDTIRTDSDTPDDVVLICADFVYQAEEWIDD